MSTHLVNVPLNELRTNDEQVLGSEHPVDGKVYRWVKNLGSTALTAGAPALLAFTGCTTASILHKVIAPSGAGAATAVVTQPVGAAVTAIAASGASTGDHGWIQVDGPASIIQQQLTTALGAGSFSIASSALDAAWASNYSNTADSATQANLYAMKAELLKPVATTGAATAVAALAYIHCK
jgi:hypothetical protein